MAVSRLGFEVDSTQARTASVDLDRLTASAGKAEKAERGLAASSRQAETATGQFGRATQGAATATAQFERSVDMVAAAQGRAMVATRATTSAIQAQSMSVGALRMRSQQLSFQLIDIGQAIPLAFQSPIHALQNFGFQIAQIGQLYAGEGGMRAALTDSISMVGRFAARLGPAAVAIGAVVGGLGLMTSAINEANGSTLGMGDVALATFQVIRDGIYDFLQPAIQAVAPWFASAWDGVLSTSKTILNNLVRLVVGSFEIIKAAVMSIPDAFIVAGQAAANGFLSAIEFMVREALVAINGLLTDINGMMRGTGMELPLAPAPMSFSVGRVDLGGAAASARLTDRFSALDTRASEIAGTDFLGQFTNAVGARATQNALAGVEEAAGSAGGAMKKAAKDGKDATDDLNKSLEKTQEAYQSAGQEAGGIIRGLIDGTLSWKDALSQALSVVLKLVQQLNPNFLGGGFFQGILGGLLGFANGGVFQGGHVTAFANGGVVSGPTVFPMANGMGLMGEAGPEAVMPLRRGADGRLGVSSHGGHREQPLRLELVSRFDADGGFHSAVERTSRPIAQEESAVASARVARSMESTIDHRTENRDVRRIRPRSPF